MGLPISNKEKAKYKDWVSSYLEGGGKASGHPILTRAREVLFALQRQQDPKRSAQQPPDGPIYPWGYFEYYEDSRTVHRDDNQLVIPLLEKEHDLLMVLLKHPLDRVSYADIGEALREKEFGTPSGIVPILNPLRGKIGDVNLGHDPQDANRGLWRYIQPWQDKPTKASGLILINRSTADYDAIIKAQVRPGFSYTRY